MSCISCLWLRRRSSCVERCSFTGAQKQKLIMASAPRREEWNVWWTCSPAASDAAESTQGGTCSGLGCSLWANPELLPPWVHPGLQTLPDLEAPPRTCMPKQDVRSWGGGCWSPHGGRRRPLWCHEAGHGHFHQSSHSSHPDYSPPGFWWTTGSALRAGPRKPRMNAQQACGPGRHTQGVPSGTACLQVTNNTGGCQGESGALPTSQTTAPRSQCPARPVSALPPKSV